MSFFRASWAQVYPLECWVAVQHRQRFICATDGLWLSRSHPCGAVLNVSQQCLISFPGLRCIWVRKIALRGDVNAFKFRGINRPQQLIGCQTHYASGRYELGRRFEGFLDEFLQTYRPLGFFQLFGACWFGFEGLRKVAPYTYTQQKSRAEDVQVWVGISSFQVTYFGVVCEQGTWLLYVHCHGGKGHQE